MDKRGGGEGVSRFASKIFCLTVPKNAVGEPFGLSLLSGVEKSYASEGYVTIFRRIFFCLTVPKHFVEEPFCSVFQKISGSEKVWIRGRGSIKISFEFFLSHSAEKYRRGTL